MFEGLLQPTHLIVIFAVAMLFFGPKKLPELGKGIGEGLKSFKEGMKNMNAEPPASDIRPTDASTTNTKPTDTNPTL